MIVSLLDALRHARLGDAPATAATSPGPGLRTRPGQKLFFQGDPADAVYLLLEGTVALQTVPSEEDEGALSLLCRAPAVIGDRDLLLGLPAREMASCLEPCALRVWDAGPFREEWDQSPALRAWLGLDLAHRYARALELQRLQQRPLAFRLAAALRALHPSHGPALPPTRFLARVVGATEKSVLRSLSWLREQEVLGTTPGDEGALSAAAVERLQGFEDLDSVTYFHALCAEPTTPV